MRVIFCRYRKKLYAGNSLECLVWAADKAAMKNLMIPVYSIRPGSSEAKIIAEVDRHGIRLITQGASIKIRKGMIWESLH